MLHCNLNPKTLGGISNKVQAAIRRNSSRLLDLSLPLTPTDSSLCSQLQVVVGHTWTENRVPPKLLNAQLDGAQPAHIATNQNLQII